MRLPTSEKSIVQLSALPVVLYRARCRIAIGEARITRPKRHLPNAYEILVTRYDQCRTGVGHFWRIFHREGGVAHQPLLAPQNKSDCRFVWYQNICSASFSFVTIHASGRQTDRQTDRQNCDSNTVRCITCSRSRTVKTAIKVKSDQNLSTSRKHYNKLLPSCVNCSDVCSFLRPNFAVYRLQVRGSP